MTQRKYWIGLVILITACMFTIDYNLAVKGSPPLFAVRTKIYKDGGTSVYYGVGYKVVNYNELDGRQDVVFKSLPLSFGKQ